MDSGNARPVVSAQNSASGSQYLSPGDGDQSVASSNGVQYIDRIDHRRQYTAFTINMSPDVPNMPSVWNLAQALGRSGEEVTEPNQPVLVDLLMRQLEHSPIDFSSQHLEIIDQVAPETGTWILSKNEIQLWRDATNSSHRYLGMYGVLGSGKTVLASLIIKSLRTEIKQRNDTACVYFYFHEGDDRSPPAALVWSTLLAQLLQHRRPNGIAKDVIAKLNNSFRGAAPIHPLEYFDLFKAQASAYKTVYIVIDALDNCTNGYDERTRHRICEALKQLPDTIRVLFTSRCDSLIPDLILRISQKLQVRPHSSDIKTYVNARIDGDVDLCRVLSDTKSREAVVRTVTDLTLESGIFLLAKLHIDNLSKQGTLADIIDRLPATSDSAFEALVRRILQTGNAFKRDLAKHVLTWVLHAKVGLTIDQVRDSFAIYKSNGDRYQESRPPKDSVMASCAGLVVEDYETKTLRLVHESVQTRLQHHQVIAKHADLEMAKTCLTSLLVDESWHIKSPLLTYSATHWCSHLGQSPGIQVQDLVKTFLRDRKSLERAFGAVPGISESTSRGVTGLHAAVYFNQLPWVKGLLEEGMDINAQCSNGQTALHWAALHGRYDMLSCLIEKSADTNIQDRTGDTALHRILMGPTADGIRAVEALIHAGARIDIKGSKGLTALSSAIRYGPTSIALLLIKSQRDVNAEVTKGWTSLKEVFYYGHHMIRDTGSSNSSSGDGWAPLSNEVKDHVHCLIGLLLERGVDLNRPTTDGWLPLIHAAKTGNSMVLGRLLERKPNPADANQRDPNDWTSALRCAFFYKHYSAVTLLIDYGAHINEMNADGWTPLIQAVQDRNEDMVWSLIKNGAQVNHTDSKGWSPLLYAIENKSKNIAWFLITNKANTKLRGTNIPSAIELALRKAEYSIAWLLCEHGVEINDVDDKGMTSLHRACESGRLKEVAFLLYNGADTRPKDTAGFTALHYAVLGGWEDVVCLFASWSSASAVIDEPDAKGNRALMLATLQRSRPMVQALVSNGAACEHQDSVGLTALQHAARLGFSEGVEILMYKDSSLSGAALRSMYA